MMHRTNKLTFAVQHYKMTLQLCKAAKLHCDQTHTLE